MKKISMFKLFFNHYNTIFLYLVCFFSYAYCGDGIQGMRRISQDIESLIKLRDDRKYQQFVKNDSCAPANISFAFEPEGNVIDFSFKLNDKKFQYCFNYIKIFIRKKDDIIKEVKVPYLKEKISYRFENVSCDIYKGVVQGCFDEKYCLEDTWYKESINVTSNGCMGILQSEIISHEILEWIVAILFIACLFMPFAFGILVYVSKKKSPKPQYTNIGYKYSVAGQKDIKIDINEDFRKEIKSIHIYVFHTYDKKKIIENRVKALKLGLDHLHYMLNDVILKDMDSTLDVHMKTIGSELLTTTCLDDVNDWLNNALANRKKDGILQRCILIESSIEVEEEDIVENEIFSYIESILRKNHEVYLKPFKLNNLSTESDPEETIQSIPDIEPIPDSSSHPYLHMSDFRNDICSEFVIPNTKESVEILCQQYFDKQSDEYQNSIESKHRCDFFRKHFKS